MPPQQSRGGPRQRFLPTPRGVNMIVWSLDNRFVLAAIMGKNLFCLDVSREIVVDIVFHIEKNFSVQVSVQIQTRLVYISLIS